MIIAKPQYKTKSEARSRSTTGNAVTVARNIHYVKSWPEFFEAVVAGFKTHELRRNDRGYKLGDVLHLKEFDPKCGAYTGREAQVEITYITSHDIPCAESRRALDASFVILSIGPVVRGTRKRTGRDVLKPEAAEEFGHGNT